VRPLEKQPARPRSLRTGLGQLEISCDKGLTSALLTRWSYLQPTTRVGNTESLIDAITQPTPGMRAPDCDCEHRTIPRLYRCSGSQGPVLIGAWLGDEVDV
jgi:hypothetical protein